MRLATSSAATALAVILAIAPAAAEPITCMYEYREGSFKNAHHIQAYGVGDDPIGVCNGFWDNLCREKFGGGCDLIDGKTDAFSISFEVYGKPRRLLSSVATPGTPADLCFSRWQLAATRATWSAPGG